MNDFSIMMIMECCHLKKDGETKAFMIKCGASKEQAEIGIKLYNYLKNKKEVVECKKNKTSTTTLNKIFPEVFESG